MPDYQPSRTLSATNQFHLACPIFNTEVPIASCFKLRDLVWKGQAPPVRRGCQACMRASKCPINNIIRGLKTGDIEPYYAVTKRVGHLVASDHARIAPVLVLDMHMRGLDVPENERALIEHANLMLQRKPKTSAELDPMPEKIRRPAKPRPEPEKSIATADMSQVVNAVMREDQA